MTQLTPRLFAIVLVWVLAACGLTVQSEAPETPFRVSSGNPETARTLLYLVPGVLSSTGVFEDARYWGNQNVLVIEYRFPGLDGRPLDSDVKIMSAATQIANHAMGKAPDRVVIFGFSTGAAIAIEAAAQLPNENVTIVGFSSAVPFPGILMASAGSGLDLLDAVTRAGRIRKGKIWQDYNKTLLLGRDWSWTEEDRVLAAQLIARSKGHILPPGGGLGRSHATNLLTWKLTDAAKKSQAHHILIHGQDDTVSPLQKVQKMARQIGADVRVIPDVGHHLLAVVPSVLDDLRDELSLN